MRRRCVLLLLVCLSSLPGFAAERSLRVRLWSQHAVQALSMTALPAVHVRSCTSCSPWRGNDFQIAVRNGALLVNGAKTPKLLVSGSYVVRVDNRPVQLSTPLEITARSGYLSMMATMPLEEYVAGVLAGEAGGMRSTEALKAMAVAIRTYAVHFHSRHAADGYDFCDSTHCQDLRLSARSTRVLAAVAATEGELLWHQGTTIASYYHQDCGGATERGTEDLSTRGRAAPYLRQQSDSWCVRRGSAQWQSTVLKSDLGRALRSVGMRVPQHLESVRIVSRSPSGRARALHIAGEFSTTVSEEQFRTAVGRTLGWQRLRSDLYEAADRGESVTFTGRGSGHGVGLCQTGASVMAEEGHNYREILAFYYPHTQLGMTARCLQWTTLGSARIDVMTARPETDGSLVGRAQQVLREAEQRSGISAGFRPVVRVYPSVAAFRDATGEPGWVAASSRGNVVRLEPLAVLQRTRSVDNVLRHEFLHLLVESKSRPDTPLWLREGLVLWLNGEAQRPVSAPLTGDQIERSLRRPASQDDLRAAYGAAQARVAMFAQKYGKAHVIGWLTRGLPPELRGN